MPHAFCSSAGTYLAAPYANRAGLVTIACPPGRIWRTAMSMHGSVWFSFCTKVKSGLDAVGLPESIAPPASSANSV